MQTFKDIIYNYGFGIFSLAVALGLPVCASLTKRKFFKYFFYNLPAIFIALFLYEVYGCFKSNSKNANVIFSGTFADNSIVSGPKIGVGYGPKEDTTFQVTAIRKNNDTLIYNVRYSFENGIRKTPGLNTKSKRKVFFLGCSFVFGDGLNDNQTLPYFFNELTGGKFQIINYAFSGYGTHQALKITEEKILKDKEIANDSSVVIYSFLPEHFLRAAGKLIWDAYGPCYQLEGGKLIYKGTFDENKICKQNWFTKRVQAIWESSNLYQSFLYPKIEEKDVIRVVEMIKLMKEQLKVKGIKFMLLLHQDLKEGEWKNYFLDELSKNKVNYFEVKSIIKDLKKNSSNYFIRGDGHPNSFYNKAVAKFLSNKVAF